MPSFETLTTDAQLKQQGKDAAVTRLLDERVQFQGKAKALQTELLLLQRELERIDQQLAQATAPATAHG